MEFCRGHLSLLAKLHDAGILHRGFTPANLMYRMDADGMKFCWIDIASCCHAIITTKRIADDIINLFRFMDLSGADRRELEEWYLNASTKRRTDAGTLSKVLEERLVRRMKRKNLTPRP
jgi:tRNA A-37 threonylcarbamoyl transferase component Bud32